MLPNQRPPYEVLVARITVYLANRPVCDRCTRTQRSPPGLATAMDDFFKTNIGRAVQPGMRSGDPSRNPSLSPSMCVYVCE